MSRKAHVAAEAAQSVRGSLMVKSGKRMSPERVATGTDAKTATRKSATLVRERWNGRGIPEMGVDDSVKTMRRKNRMEEMESGTHGGLRGKDGEDCSPNRR
jgi:hypothetical protein